MDRPAVFLDRDGTIIKDVGYLDDADLMEFIPGAAEAISRLNRAGIGVVIVTNQSGVARGSVRPETISLIHERLIARLALQGAWVDAIYVCPHHPDGVVPEYSMICNCRKPMTGMVDQACADHDIDPFKSYVVGDKSSDIELGRRVGARTVLLRPEQGESGPVKESADIKPDKIARDLFEAVDWILG